MQHKETLKVFIDFQNGKVICMCLRSHRRCNKPCLMDTVERDKYRGWQQLTRVDKYGKTTESDDD